MLKIALFAGLTLLTLGLICFLLYRCRRAPIQIRDDRGKVLLSSTGATLDKDVVRLFDNLYAQVRNAVRKSKAERHIREMRKALKKASSRLNPETVKYCNSILDKAQNRLNLLEKKEAGTLSEAQRAQLQKEQARRRKAKEQKAQKREEKRAKEEASSQHRQFVAEQRRLMKDSLRYDVMKRDGFRCQLCGATAQDHVRLHVDHIVPVSKGGKTEFSNLRTLCERCNMGKSDKLETPMEIADSTPTRQVSDTISP